ncbi:MAG: flagellar FliL protein [Halieaceae bacterium]|jgi:flagellar FliL protein
MAKKEDLNLGKDGAAEETPGGKSKMMIIVIAVVVLLGGGAGAFFLLGGSGEEGAETAAEPVVEAPAEPLYLELEKLLVNLEYQGRTRYLQTEMQLMTYEQTVIDKATRDMPAIRNRLIMLFSAQEFAALKTVEGKEALRQETLGAINEVLGLTPPEAVDAMYFESLVLQ